MHGGSAAAPVEHVAFVVAHIVELQAVGVGGNLQGGSLGEDRSGFADAAEIDADVSWGFHLYASQFHVMGIGAADDGVVAPAAGGRSDHGFAFGHVQWENEVQHGWAVDPDEDGKNGAVVLPAEGAIAFQSVVVGLGAGGLIGVAGQRHLPVCGFRGLGQAQGEAGQTGEDGSFQDVGGSSGGVGG